MTIKSSLTAFLILGVLAPAGVIAAAGAASSDNDLGLCEDVHVMIEWVADNYDEQIVEEIAAHDFGYSFITASPAGTFTLFSVDPNGIACIEGAGTDFTWEAHQ